MHKFKKVGTPFLDDKSLPSADFETSGELAGDAASMVMKLLWLARMTRKDLLRQTNLFASMVSKWSVACDKMLERYMFYLYHTLDHAEEMTVSDTCDNWELHLYQDADHAGCTFTKRSTSGIYIEIASSQHTSNFSGTHAPISGRSEKQSSTATSTPEAELIAAKTAIQNTGIPILDLLEGMLGRTVALKSFEDNDTAILDIKNGYSPKMRHLKRIHNVSLTRLHECYHGDHRVGEMLRKDSSEMRADIFTKGFTEFPKWQHALSLINIRPPLSKR